MARLEELTRGASVKGILPEGLVTIVDVKWHGSDVIEVTYKDASGRPANELLYRDREPSLEIVTQGTPFSFDGDGAQFRLASEARRISLAHLFDPLRTRSPGSTKRCCLGNHCGFCLQMTRVRARPSWPVY